MGVFQPATNRRFALEISRRALADSRVDPYVGMSWLGLRQASTYRLAAANESTSLQRSIPLPKPISRPPVVLSRRLKPATHATMNRFTADKAWPVANREELLAPVPSSRS